jgi:hypothetical protein
MGEGRPPADTQTGDEEDGAPSRIPERHDEVSPVRPACPRSAGEAGWQCAGSGRGDSA